MPDKLTDAEIKKALYDYKNSNLIQVGNGKVISISDIIDLINRLQAENKRLTTLAELGNMRANDYRVMRDRALKAEAENERLNTYLDVIGCSTDKIKAEAYKRCIENAKEELYEWVGADDSIPFKRNGG